ncbi:hypothetical protein GCT13_13275 [Paraburkholderia sp. CNPSo 3157]|uniref:Mu-like prophage FluMu N-terminal domain-containing protein n=1 Tax=Paraburkholderia franconis TaxID=2654983 RepID=A0A7X1NAB1_9BURK|nr:hypothetical protein [Paraburkholderia franconis]MPW17881.1 hypothetical protein [Paraburkholderia franconis]
MKLVKITRHHGRYTPGDVAGFDDERAQTLIDSGIAEEHVPETKDDVKAAKGDATKAAAAKG